MACASHISVKLPQSEYLLVPGLDYSIRGIYDRAIHIKQEAIDCQCHSSTREATIVGQSWSVGHFELIKGDILFAAPDESQEHNTDCIFYA